MGESFPGIVENINRGGSLTFVMRTSPAGVLFFSLAMASGMARSMPSVSSSMLAESMGPRAAALLVSLSKMLPLWALVFASGDCKPEMIHWIRSSGATVTGSVRNWISLG